MYAYVMDSNYRQIDILEVYESFIWTDRYNSVGDFEIVLSPSAAVMKSIAKDRYLWIKGSDRLMMIRKKETTTDIEEGSKNKITGESLETVLKRRRICNSLKFENANFQSSIKQILDENIISPSDSSRRIPNFTFVNSSDSRISALTFTGEFLGENVYEVIEEACQTKNVGFRVKPNWSNGGFVFELYMGTDRSYDQTMRPPVVFSPGYENLISSSYTENSDDYATAALLIGGKIQESTVTTIIGSGSGLGRYETTIELSNVSTKYDRQITNEDGEPDTESVEYTVDEYKALLAKNGNEKLPSFKIVTAFQGEVDYKRQFIYERDFQLGDIVQIENEFQMKGKVRVSEVMHSVDLNGSLLIPTFVGVN